MAGVEKLSELIKLKRPEFIEVSQRTALTLRNIVAPEAGKLKAKYGYESLFTDSEDPYVAEVSQDDSPEKVDCVLQVMGNEPMCVVPHCDEQSQRETADAIARAGAVIWLLLRLLNERRAA